MSALISSDGANFICHFLYPPVKYFSKPSVIEGGWGEDSLRPKRQIIIISRHQMSQTKAMHCDHFRLANPTTIVGAKSVPLIFVDFGSCSYTRKRSAESFSYTSHFVGYGESKRAV
jgi:hypothetical protein